MVSATGRLVHHYRDCIYWDKREDRLCMRLSDLTYFDDQSEYISPPVLQHTLTKLGTSHI